MEIHGSVALLHMSASCTCDYDMVHREKLVEVLQEALGREKIKAFILHALW